MLVEPPFPEISGVTFESIGRFPGYCFGNDGCVFGCRNKNGKPGFSPRGWYRFKITSNPNGRLYVGLINSDGVNIRVSVAALVLEAFVGPRPPGMEACHFPDKDFTNNRLDNLRWDTPKNNAKDRALHGSTARGERVGRSKMTADKVAELRRLHVEGFTGRELSGRFGISPSQVSQIISGRSWSHVTR